MAASSSSGGLSAFIDQGSEFEGKLSFKDTVRIDGRFRGEISSENTLIVGETGEIDRCRFSSSAWPAKIGWPAICTYPLFGTRSPAFLAA
jgi:hypothetical protein